MNKRELVSLVESMRRAQTTYFRSPSGSREKDAAYREAREMERRVDAACREVRREEEPSLFNPQGGDDE